MSEQPANIVAREARKIHQSLKELLKTKEPFDKEVDFQRKSLRRNYLILLLVHPDAKESKDVENHLWMQTSYAFIASYKQRIAALDRGIQNHQRPQQHQQQQQPYDPSIKQTTSHHGVVEHRKLIQRFKQFLADEEKFWTQLVRRLLRLFALHEARPALITLGLLDEVDEVVGAAVAAASSDLDSTGRNHFQFPSEDPSLTFSPATSEEREARLSTLSKALICLGDIARYREHYNESNGRARAGHDDNVPARRGRNRRGGGPESVARPRNYDKAQQCYEQARLLVPHEGNPSHQLAILASYQKDSFSSIIHYYRSLCVRQPYDTAAENLGTVLAKSLDNWRQQMKKDKDKNRAESELPPKIRNDLLKERIVVLHALWRVGMEKGVEKIRSISPKHNEKVVADFYARVSERHLTIDAILNMIVLSQGALWKHRMIRDVPSSHQRTRSESASVPPNTATLIEWSILDHVLDLHRALLEVGKEELKDPPPLEDQNDLAQRISATFRRTLPALRMASKWLRANFKYLAQDQEFIAFQEQEKSKGSTAASKGDSNKISEYSIKTIKFWKSYAAFTLALSKAFPWHNLPPFEGPLEEDIEMRGFLPLRNLIGEGRKTGDKASVNVGQPTREQVHPNVEQLMRIADLLDDAKLLATLENSPIMLINNHFVFNLELIEDELSSAEMPQQVVRETTLPVQQQELLPTVRDATHDLNTTNDHDADNMMESTSHTDDDPVREAFNFLNASSAVDDDEDDEIVYMRSPTLSPKAPVTPVKPLQSPEIRSPRSPVLHHANKVSPVKHSSPTPAPVSITTTTTTTTTAQDLLNNVMGVGNLRSMGALQPKFLFGSELSHRSSQSIWSAVEDEQPLMYAANGTSGSVAPNNGQLSGFNSSHTVGVIGGPVPSGGFHPTNNLQTTGAADQIYQTPPQVSFPVAPSSHDVPFSNPSIWSSSYGDSANSPQRHIPFSSRALAQPSQPGLGSAFGQQHRREHSASLTLHGAQLYSGHNIQQSDPFAHSPVQQQPSAHRPDFQLPATTSRHVGSPLGHGGVQAFGMSTTNGGSYLGDGNLIVNGASQQFYPSAAPAYHSRQLSVHDSRVNSGQPFMSSTGSRNWG